MQINLDFLYSLIRFHSLLNVQIVHELKYVAILLAVAPQFLVISVLAKSQMPAKNANCHPNISTQWPVIHSATFWTMHLSQKCCWLVIVYFGLGVSITCWYRSFSATQPNVLANKQFFASLIFTFTVQGEHGFKIVAGLCVVVSLAFVTFVISAPSHGCKRYLKRFIYTASIFFV